MASLDNTHLSKLLRPTLLRSILAGVFVSLVVCAFVSFFFLYMESQAKVWVRDAVEISKTNRVLFALAMYLKRAMLILMLCGFGGAVTVSEGARLLSRAGNPANPTGGPR